MPEIQKIALLYSLLLKANRIANAHWQDDTTDFYSERGKEIVTAQNSRNMKVQYQDLDTWGFSEEISNSASSQILASMNTFFRVVGGHITVFSKDNQVWLVGDVMGPICLNGPSFEHVLRQFCSVETP